MRFICAARQQGSRFYMAYASSIGSKSGQPSGGDMRNQRSTGLGDAGWDDPRGRYNAEVGSRNRRYEPANSNSPEEIFGEVGLVLVIVLGIVLAINTLLIALHIS
jgi:hypothetical protein